MRSGSGSVLVMAIAVALTACSSTAPKLTQAASEAKVLRALSGHLVNTGDRPGAISALTKIDHPTPTDLTKLRQLRHLERQSGLFDRDGAYLNARDL